MGRDPRPIDLGRNERIEKEPSGCLCSTVASHGWNLPPQRHFDGQDDVGPLRSIR